MSPKRNKHRILATAPLLCYNVVMQLTARRANSIATLTTSLAIALAVVFLAFVVLTKF